MSASYPQLTPACAPISARPGRPWHGRRGDRRQQLAALYLLHVDPLRDLPDRATVEEGAGEGHGPSSPTPRSSPWACRDHATVVFPRRGVRREGGHDRAPGGRLSGALAQRSRARATYAPIGRHRRRRRARKASLQTRAHRRPSVPTSSPRTSPSTPASRSKGIKQRPADRCASDARLAAAWAPRRQQTIQPRRCRPARQRRTAPEPAARTGIDANVTRGRGSRPRLKFLEPRQFVNSSRAPDAASRHRPQRLGVVAGSDGARVHRQGAPALPTRLPAPPSCNQAQPRSPPGERSTGPADEVQRA